MEQKRVIEFANMNDSIKPIDKILDVFQKITEEEKNIASKFHINDKDLKELCRKCKCIVQADWANLLKGIERKILIKQPELKGTKKLQITAYQWHKNHPRSSKKFCEKSFKQLKEDNLILWRDRKIHNLITLGIHPKLLSITYTKYGNFSKAIKYLEEFDSEYKINSISSFLLFESDTESDNSQITVINTQESGKNAINTEELINNSQNYVEVKNMNFVFNSEEINESNISTKIESMEPAYISEEIVVNSRIELATKNIESQLQSYDEFNYDEIKLTSTQKV